MISVSQLTSMLVRGNPDVLGVLVVDGDGKVHASESASDDLVQAAVAITVPLRELLDRAAAELGCGEMTATVVEGRESSVAISDVDGFRTVVVIGASGVAAGALRADSLWAADCLRNDRIPS